VQWRVGLESYEVRGKHGYFDHEHEAEQPFVFTVWVEFERETISELEESINYADLQTTVDDVVLNAIHPIRLLEEMAHQIIERLSTRALLTSISVRIEKPEAPLPHPGGRPVIEVHWRP